MKIRAFLSILAIAIFALASCTTEAPKQEKEIKLDTRGIEATVAEEKAPSSFVTGTWKNGDIWVKLKIDLTFEGSFDGGDVIIGKWSLSDDEKTLTLTEGKGTEGKGQSFVKTYTVLELSDAVMHVEDADGTVLELQAQ